MNTTNAAANAGDNATEYTPWIELLSHYSFLITFFLQGGLVLLHCSKVHSDLHTDKRKVLNYRRSKPDVTKEYKQMVYLTLLCIVVYWIYPTFEMLLTGPVFDTCSKTNWVLTVAFFWTIGFFGGKCLNYLVLLYRVHQTFNSSAYGYGAVTLKAVAAFLIAMSVLLMASLNFFYIANQPVTVIYDDTDNEYPYFCSVGYDDQELQLLLGLGVAVTDLVGTLCTVGMFIRSLDRVIKACENQEQNYNPAQKKSLRKMVYIGSKYKILVLFSSCTTWASILSYMAGYTEIALPVTALVYFLDPLCLALMTEYYPSDMYYERLCCLCVVCCDRGKRSYTSHASDVHDDKSVDLDSTVVQSSQAPSIPTSLDTDQAAKRMADEIGAKPVGSTSDTEMTHTEQLEIESRTKTT